MRVVDLFAGCGGLSKGLLNAGLDVTLAIEKWSPARAVYEKNFEHPVLDLDLEDLIDAAHRVARERPDVVVGGPPCQDFSSAGHRIEREKAALTVTFAEIVRAVRPQWFLMENVAQARSSSSWRTARTLLADAGYGITEEVFDASLFGVPQYRKRLFLIGRLDVADGFLCDEIESRMTDEPLSVRGYLGDELGVDFYYQHPRHWGRRAIFSVDEPAPTIRSSNRPIPPKYKPHPLDAGPIARAKRLTSEQRARIQTFPRRFKFGGFMSDMDIMIANAVPVNLATKVGRSILAFEKSPVLDSEDAFRRWLERKYEARTAGNVISRLHRVQNILQKRRLEGDPRDVMHELAKRQEFTALSGSVRSQLRQAVKLAFEFRSGSGR